jgi:hypothetical protein
MKKVKKRRTPAQKRARKAAKAERKKKYQWVFINGRQARIKRSPTVDNPFIGDNFDLILLHQNELWELMPEQGATSGPEPSKELAAAENDDGIPF